MKHTNDTTCLCAYRCLQWGYHGRCVADNGHPSPTNNHFGCTRSQRFYTEHDLWSLSSRLCFARCRCGSRRIRSRFRTRWTDKGAPPPHQESRCVASHNRSKQIGSGRFSEPMALYASDTDVFKVNWDKDRYDEICGLLKPFLAQCGFHPSKTSFVPVGAVAGINLVHRKRADAEQLSTWYKGPTLVDLLGW